MRKILITVFLLCFICGCSNLKQEHTSDMLKDSNQRLARQYTELQTASTAFLSRDSQKQFLEKLDTYMVKNYQELSSEGVSKMKILFPVLTDKSKTKAIVLGLNRISDNIGRRVDCVRFVSCRYVNNQWYFAFKPGYTHLITYTDENEPLLTDEEVARSTITTVMQLNYYKDNNTKASEKLFQSIFYYL
ncbi:hypothetical protein HYN59_01345 [Flavobacterium album]|uniref:Uncharacterized protein n=1 Tax=Flavobacterium album TaxID=2175091 RepID=A0A2S1QTZ3_9FLAO|nr:hypothetical protein [Flavobacterium album]AWH83843.1 hypothetical protein HYN59_01345 [Flavobacterium album]